MLHPQSTWPTSQSNVPPWRSIYQPFSRCRTELVMSSVLGQEEKNATKRMCLKCKVGLCINSRFCINHKTVIFQIRILSHHGKENTYRNKSAVHLDLCTYFVLLQEFINITGNNDCYNSKKLHYRIWQMFFLILCARIFNNISEDVWISSLLITSPFATSKLKLGHQPQHLKPLSHMIRLQQNTTVAPERILEDFKNSFQSWQHQKCTDS
jgi:hypothetical protein